MKKVVLSDTKPGQRVRIRPNTVTLTVHMHLNGQTRIILKNEGFWRDSKDLVYLEQ